MPIHTDFQCHNILVYALLRTDNVFIVHFARFIKNALKTPC